MAGTPERTKADSKISIMRINEEAGLSRGNIYHYKEFVTKAKAEIEIYKESKKKTDIIDNLEDKKNKEEKLRFQRDKEKCLKTEYREQVENYKQLTDIGGCDALIRSNPPSPLFVGFGPTNGADCSTEGPLDRYKGGQVIELDLSAMTVTMKLHKATFDHPDKVPYYTVFDASKAPPAGFMGVIHAPKLGNLGRFGDNDAVGRIAQFSNGVRLDDGGPNRYQQGITSYAGGQSQTYSPMWHISWIFFDCNENGVFFDAEHNVGEGAVPVLGSGIPGFDPADPATFDPFQMDDKDVDCLGFAAEATGNSDGFIESLKHLDDLIDDGDAIQTEGPAGLRLDSPLQPPLIVNCPVPLTVKIN